MLFDDLILTGATCAIHAVGKAVVEILDGFGLDCDQTQVVKNLIERVQPNKKAVSIERFHMKPCDVVVWRKGQSDDKKKKSLNLWIQRQEVGEQYWSGPKISDEERKENHMGLVGLWLIGDKTYKHHAVYVKSCKKITRGI